MSTLRLELAKLKDLRAEAASAAAQLRAAREMFDFENKGLISLVRETAQAAELTETGVKAMALSLFKIFGEKKVAPGVEVKMFREYLIDEKAGLAWATEKDLCLIPASLDLAAIKKLATVQPLPFVLIDEVPRVQIASDLSKVELPDAAAPVTAVA